MKKLRGGGAGAACLKTWSRLTAAQQECTEAGPHHLSRSEPPGSRAPSPCTIDSRVPPEPTKAPSPSPRPPSRLSWYQSKSPFFLSSTVPDPCAVPSPGLFPHLTMKGFVSQPHPLRSQDATGDRIPDPSSPGGPTARRRALGPGPDTQPQHRPAHRPLPAFTRDAGRGRAGGRPFRPLPGSLPPRIRARGSKSRVVTTSPPGSSASQHTSFPFCTCGPDLRPVRLWAACSPGSRAPFSPRLARPCLPGLLLHLPASPLSTLPHTRLPAPGCVHVRSCPTPGAPWTAARRQAPPSAGFSRQEHWSGLPFSPPRDLPCREPTHETLPMTRP
ncbi:uncharacterized protein ACBT57_011548 [Dama dama]|uniref:proline-rich protein 2-like n=1 Tax=Dama dama TaxID=30532 RepID=UPI002A368DCF|nr:proline-rich protein 2-like [Dama dama]